MQSVIVNALLVGSGGFIGAVFRYGLSGMVQRTAPLSSVPWGTVAVNLLGCLLIGVVAGLIESRQWFSTEARLFILIGVLGGFTTFSALGFEAFELLRNAEYLRAFCYVAVQVFAGLALIWGGFVVAASRGAA